MKRDISGRVLRGRNAEYSTRYIPVKGEADGGMGIRRMSPVSIPQQAAGAGGGHDPGGGNEAQITEGLKSLKKEKTTMKKIVSLILALAMILSCTAVLAAETGSTGTNMTNEHIGAQENFAIDDPTTKTSASQSTDIWLQVEAAGQIDVTIPLVAVFKTNIDGGTSTIGSNYKMINNSSAAIKVAKVVVTDQNVNVTTNGQPTANMTLVKAFTGKYDEYTLTMKPTDYYTEPYWKTAENVAEFSASNPYTKDSKQGNTYVEKKGLWRVEKSDKAAGGKDESYIELVLTTSKLDFVTLQKDTIKNGDVNTIEDGVKIVTINYTVMIDDSEGVGEDIKGSSTETATWTNLAPVTTTVSYSYTGDN